MAQVYTSTDPLHYGSRRQSAFHHIGQYQRIRYQARSTSPTELKTKPFENYCQVSKEDSFMFI
jgi:hypothetical protein